MRGARQLVPGSGSGLDIIPADAGSTLPAPARCVDSRDHPRGCGEHYGSYRDLGQLLGSSPRMRGAPLSVLGQDTQFRIIPADAGSTQEYMRQSIDRKDHPRGCGEHWSGRERTVGSAGSSPRMRGAPQLDTCVSLRYRIIPADAGSTGPGLGGCGLCEDHPRGCGEHNECVDRGGTQLGSSPRMRGAHSPVPRHDRVRRIIPADAGST